MHKHSSGSGTLAGKSSSGVPSNTLSRLSSCAVVLTDHHGLLQQRHSSNSSSIRLPPHFKPRSCTHLCHQIPWVVSWLAVCDDYDQHRLLQLPLAGQVVYDGLQHLGLQCRGKRCQASVLHIGQQRCNFSV